MFKFFQNFKKKRETKRLLLGFYEEIKRNLELYYVMNQLGEFRLFCLDYCRRIKDNPVISSDERILICLEKIEDFNRIMTEFSQYQEWYNLDINNKTRENAQTLHSHKENVFEKLKGIDRVISVAKKALERKLHETKFPETTLSGKIFFGSGRDGNVCRAQTSSLRCGTARGIHSHLS